MKILRWLAAGVVGTVGGLLGLVGALLCVTLVLLPLGIPVLMLARRLFSLAGWLVVPRAVRHPVDELDRAGEAATGRFKKRVREGAEAGVEATAGVGRAVGKRSRRALGKRSGRTVSDVLPRRKRKIWRAGR